MNLKISALFILMALSLIACVSTGGPQKTKLDPSKAIDTRLDLGMKYLDAGNRDQALRQFLDVLSTDKKNARGLQGLAIVHQLNGEMEDAEKAFKKSLSYANKEQINTIRYTYGLFLSRESRFAEAQAQFEAVAKEIGHPQRATALYYIGRCALELNNLDRAKGAFTHSLNLQSSMAAPALELADLSFQERDYSSAKNYLDRYNKRGEASARSLWIGIRLERIFGNQDKEASLALALKNMFGYSQEYLEYKQLMGNN